MSDDAEQLRAALQKATDKLCHYATDYPQPDTLSIVNESDKLLSRGHFKVRAAQPSPSATDRIATLERIAEAARETMQHIGATQGLIDALSALAALDALPATNPKTGTLKR